MSSERANYGEKAYEERPDTLAGRPEPKKFDGSKLRFDLIPTYPLARLAEVYTIGAKKYGDRNWEGGLKFTRLIAAMERHLLALKAGEDYDQADGQHHAASVAWGAFALMFFEGADNPDNLDDRPQDPRTLERLHGLS